MIVIPSKLEGLRLNARTNLSTLWKIERTDGVVFRFTDRDEVITFESETYKPTGGLDASAKQAQEGLNTRNFEARGLINSDDITQADLRAGRFREAKVSEYLVDAQYPFAGAFFETAYWISEITYDGRIWNAQMQDRSRWLRMNIGDLIGRNCRWDLGDAHCGISLASFSQNQVVTSVTLERLKFRASSMTTGGAYVYQYGTIEWTGGLNDGITHEIKLFTSATKQVDLQLQTPFDIQIGDTFTIRRGCDKTKAMCKDVFSNYAKYGGFPDVPGTEQMLTTPNAS
jgi:uncharacterized phage protein (TIGR02218 family)